MFETYFHFEIKSVIFLMAGSGTFFRSVALSFFSRVSAACEAVSSRPSLLQSSVVVCAWSLSTEPVAPRSGRWFVHRVYKDLVREPRWHHHVKNGSTLSPPSSVSATSSRKMWKYYTHPQPLLTQWSVINYSNYALQRKIAGHA